MSVDIYDENGVGGGASGVSGGLLHPYSPKGPVRLSIISNIANYGLKSLVSHPTYASQRIVWNPVSSLIQFHYVHELFVYLQ